MISYLRTFKHEVKKIYRHKESQKNKRHRKDKPHDDVHQ